MSSATPVIDAVRGGMPSPAGGGVTIDIGEIPIRLEPTDAAFGRTVAERYAGFVNSAAHPEFEFDVLLENAGRADAEDVRVWKSGSVWKLERGDFRAEWNPVSRSGWVRQSANPYSIDTVLRITHTLVLAEQGGFLVHASSAIRNGRAFLFAGVSGAGKTTMARLAPADVTLLTDEISYVRRAGAGYRAYGTPFAGELEQPGENVAASVGGLYLLEKGAENRIEAVDPATAARSLLRHILFFARDGRLVKQVFASAMEFVSRVSVSKLVFTPDWRAWELIR